VELDFSKLENIAYRGFEGEKARAEKDKLIEQGFTVIEGATTPFDAPPAQEATPTTSPKSPVQRQLEPFTGMDKSRNYRAMYRAACNFHERHNPPTVDKEYWKSHIPGKDETPEAELQYWEKAVEDIGVTAGGFNNDPFLIGLLIAIFEELEREYKAMKAAKCL
jgi:hypothetical protein